MKTIKIGNRIVGDGYPTLIIVEAGINHNGSLSMAKKMIDVAATCGADVIKFQKRDLNTLYRKDVLDDPNKEGQSFQYLLPLLKELELSEADYHELFDHCKKKGIMFLCTPWDKKSADFLESLGVEAYKIGSPDMTNLELLEYVARKGKPMIVSTGMSRFEEIETTVKFLNSIKAEFILMHCNSTYPCAFKDVNLRFINTLKEKFKVPVGYSGHERGIVISTVAVALGANAIERHFTLDRTMRGPDHAMSIEPQGLARMVKYIRTTEISLGDGKKKFTRGEGVEREVLSKSLVSTMDLKKGTILKKEMITAKSPGKGLSPQLMQELIGKRLKRDVKADTNFEKEDIEGEI